MKEHKNNTGKVLDFATEKAAQHIQELHSRAGLTSKRIRSIEELEAALKPHIDGNKANNAATIKTGRENMNTDNKQGKGKLTLGIENEGRTFGASSLVVPDEIGGAFSAYNLPKPQDMDISQSLTMHTREAIEKALDFVKSEIRESGFNPKNLCFAFAVMCFDKKELENNPQVILSETWGPEGEGYQYPAPEDMPDTHTVIE